MNEMLGTKRFGILLGLASLLLAGSVLAQSYDLTELYPDKRAMDAANRSVSKGKMDFAVKSYITAAEYGNKEAQKLVGLSYLDGSGVKQDNQKACAWLRLAATTGELRLVSAYNDLDGRLSEEDRKGAEKEFAKLLKSYSDDAALSKRKKWVRKELRSSSGSGASRPSPNMRVQVSLTPGRTTTVTMKELQETLDSYVEDFEKSLDSGDS